MSRAAEVAINARAAARHEIGGVERVTCELAERLPAARPERYRVIRPPRALAHRAGHLWEQVLLPAAARGARLVLSPANTAPVASGRNVVMIHDAAAITHPEWYGRTYSAWQRRLLPAVALRAVRIVTPSAYSRDELVGALGANPDRVAIVPPGVSERFDPRAPVPDIAGEGPYVLAVGTRVARKNLTVLAEAAATLEERGIRLLRVGSGRGYMTAEDDGWMGSLGYVPDDLLPGLYAGALALAMPSLHEGFGLPAIEAMACGTPVVCANRGALPTTCGEAALVVEPQDVGAALLSLVGDPAERARLSAAGIERARGFGWERTAAGIDAVVDDAIAELDAL